MGVLRVSGFWAKAFMGACSSRPWLLEDAPGSVSHRGALEGGLSGGTASAGYFVLLREGDAFTAFPADQFYNFRPTQRSAPRHALCCTA